MLLALDSDWQRVAATPRAAATCPTCSGDVRAKCGSIVVHHWAHVSGEDCDSFAEPMTAWHRDWQACWPTEYREVVMGPHRADVRTPDGAVIELQHSAISPEEIAAREAFYGPGMVWVFDAIEAANRVEHLVWEDEMRRRRELCEAEIAAHSNDCAEDVHFMNNETASWLADRVLSRYVYSETDRKCIRRMLVPGFDLLRATRSNDLTVDIALHKLIQESIKQCALTDKGSPPDEPYQRIELRKPTAFDWREGQRYVTFRWKRPRKSVATCTRPVFLDVGADELLQLGRIHPDAPCGGWGYLWSRDTFLRAFGGAAFRSRLLSGEVL